MAVIPPQPSDCAKAIEGAVVSEAPTVSAAMSDGTVEALPSLAETALSNPSYGQESRLASLSDPPTGTGPPIARLKSMAKTMPYVPALYKRVKPGTAEASEISSVTVPEWSKIKQAKLDGNRRYLGLDSSKPDGFRQAVHKVTKISKAKGNLSGRTYTSKYRGVHQTFPTRRWEAQFRRNGKPTSLGCFDFEEEAARAYDKMMIW
mmetsp:Transcript_3859/g.10931  ORF Transcript_3859/g.10931 Transcript_3859/m.10931 type:complete len:205 (-) Transcript_3859:52-666(-)